MQCPRHRLVLWCTISASIALALWVLFLGTPAPPVSIMPHVGNGSASAIGEAQRPSDPRFSRPNDHHPAGRTAPTATTTRTVQVLVTEEATGEPVPGCLVLRLPEALRPPQEPQVWWQEDWRSAAEPRESHRTGETGTLTLPAVDLPGVWAFSHPGSWTTVLPGSELTGQPVQLRAAPAMSATVVSAMGEPQVGASVQVLVLPDGECPPFRVEYTTDEGGRVLLSPVEGRMIVSASQLGTRSEPWAGRGGGVEITLTLAATFSARGRVLSGANGLPAGAVVRARRTLQNWLDAIESTLVEPDGRWNMKTLPLVDGASYTFRFEADGLVPQRRRVARPVAGQVVEIDFEAIAGNRLEVVVLDEGDRTGIGAADLISVTDVEGHLVRTRETTDENGRALFEELPSGLVRLFVQGSEYPQAEFGPFDVPTETSVTLELAKGRGLSGRCVRGGEPVESFEVHYWVGIFHRGGEVSRKQVQGSEDGSFSIDEPLKGQLSVFAIESGHPQSNIATVDLEAEGEPTVLLEIPEPCMAFGRVADARTLEPLTEASVQVFTSSGFDLMEPLGEAHAVDASGGFDSVPLCPHGSGLRYSAPGYLPNDHHPAALEEGGRWDAGTVFLMREQPLKWS